MTLGPKKILYVSYINSFPPMKGEQVHIYHTIKELVQAGNVVYALPHEKHPDVINIDESDCVEFAKKHADVVYVRHSMHARLEWTARIGAKSRRPIVVWEVNAPPFELEYATAKYYEQLGSNSVKKILRRMQLAIEIARIRYTWRRLRSTMSRIDGLVTVSKTMEHYLRKEVDVPVVAVPNGATPCLLFQELQDHLNVLVAGSALPWIDWETPRAAAKAVRRMENIKFHVVGRRWPIGDNVIHYETMTQDAMKELVKRCHVGLVSYQDFSWSDIGFYNSPLKLFEYMGSGKVVIATGRGQINDVVDDGVNGFLTEPYSVEGIVKCLVELSRDARLVREVSLSAYGTIVKAYTWRHTVNRYLEFFDLLNSL